MKAFDFVMLIISISIAAYSFVSIKKDISVTQPTLEIKANGNTYLYPLNKDGQYSIKGKVGISIIEVKDGKARFVSSECPNETCVQTGFISKDGISWAACLPNDVFIHIKMKDNDMDAISF